MFTVSELARGFMRAFTRSGSDLAQRLARAGADRNARQEIVLKWLQDNPRKKRIFQRSGFHVNDLVALATEAKK